MGFRVVNAVILGKDPKTILEEASLTPTGEFVDFPDDPVCGARLPSGGYALYINRPDVSDRIFKKLSQGASVLALEVNETVMYTRLIAFRDGQEIWSVWHDAQDELNHIETSGDVPASYQSILADQLALVESDGEVDFIFDVPVNLFVAEGGFRYDQTLEVDSPEPWEILKQDNST